MVLKCEQGFVGYKSSSSTKMECNKACYETIKVERGGEGQVFLKSKLTFFEVFFSDFLYLSCKFTSSIHIYLINVISLYAVIFLPKKIKFFIHYNVKLYLYVILYVSKIFLEAFGTQVGKE